jgi:hypothetical protein
LCGALTGTIIITGLKHGANKTIVIEKEKAYNLARELYDQFAKECGSPFCRELIGYDLTNPKVLERLEKSNVHGEKDC